MVPKLKYVTDLQGPFADVLVERCKLCNIHTIAEILDLAGPLLTSGATEVRLVTTRKNALSNLRIMVSVSIVLYIQFVHQECELFVGALNRFMPFGRSEGRTEEYYLELFLGVSKQISDLIQQIGKWADEDPLGFDLGDLVQFLSASETVVSNSNPPDNFVPPDDIGLDSVPEATPQHIYMSGTNFSLN